MGLPAATSAFDELLVKYGELPVVVLMYGFHKPQLAPARSTTTECSLALVLLPPWQVWHEVDAKDPSTPNHRRNGHERGPEVPVNEQRLQHAVRRHHHRESETFAKGQLADIPSNSCGPRA